LLTGTIFSFSVCDEAVFSAGAAWELSELAGSTMKGMGDGKDSRSRCSDELFVLARVVCSCLPASTSALLTGTIFSFSACDETVFSAGVLLTPQAG
jgi:hypothetical protein